MDLIQEKPVQKKVHYSWLVLLWDIVVLENQELFLQSKKYNLIYYKYIYLSYSNTTKWKEILFKIKLTEEEYKLLMQEKSKSVLKI